MDDPVEPAAKRKRNSDTDKILAQIQNHELELVEWKGKSTAWKKFVKLRNTATKTFIDFVQCKECKVLRVYSRKNGTTTLNNHKCHNDENDTPIFKEASPELSLELKTIFTKKLMELCVEDVIPVELVGGSGFLRFVQSVSSIAVKYGNIDLRKIVPSVSSVQRSIENTKSKQQLNIAENFQKSIAKDWVSLSMNVYQIGLTEEQYFLVAKASYFNEDLTTFGNHSLFTVPVQNFENLNSDIRKEIKQLGCDEGKLNDVYVVTPGKELFIKILESNSKRENCMAFTINSILKTSIKNSGNEIGDNLSNCNGIVRFIIGTEKYSKLVVVEDVGTWKSKVGMINSLTRQYTDIINLLNIEEKYELKFNKSRAEELAQFLQVFVEAIEDLQSTTHTTINKILPWYFILLEHLNSTEENSIEMKLFKHQTKSIFTAKFVPTMIQKVACFLDPRYRQLKMLSESERNDVMEEIRFHLKKMPTEVFENNEQEVENPQQKKKSRFSRFEANDEDVGEKDEINIYIHSIQLKEFNFDDEFNIIREFWNKNQQKLPKLFKLATTKLHFPACCCGGKDSFQRENIPLGQLENLIMIRGAFIKN